MAGYFPLVVVLYIALWIVEFTKVVEDALLNGDGYMKGIFYL